MSRAVRLRMAGTGEKYTTALRAVEADPAELERLRAAVREKRQPRYEECLDENNGGPHGLQYVISVEDSRDAEWCRLACGHTAAIDKE